MAEHFEIVNGERVAIAAEDEEETKSMSLDEIEDELKASGLDDDPGGDDPNADPDELEDWQKVDDTSGSMPVTTHIKVKQKLKGRLRQADDELAALRAKVDMLEKGSVAAPAAAETPIQPKRADYDDEDTYFEAIDDYHEKMTEVRISRADFQRTQGTRQKELTEKVKANVDDHYNRAAELVSKTGIKPEIYQQTDSVFRETIDKIMPNLGDQVADQLIANMGEGSEKVVYYVVRNGSALNEFKGLLAEDPSGIKASIFLGKHIQRFSKDNGRSATSRAPAPAANASGDATATAQGRALKRKYDAAHKAKNGQQAYDIKKKARQAKIDTSGW